MENFALNRYLEERVSQGYAWPEPNCSALNNNPEYAELNRTWRLLLRKTYGPKALRIGYAIFNRALRLEHLGYIQTHAEALAHRLAEAPHLAALLTPFVRVEAPVPSDYAVIRTPMLSRGLTPAGWRWLCHQSRESVGLLLAFGWTEELVTWLNLLARALPGTRIHPGWLEAGRPYGLGRVLQLMTGWSLGSKVPALAQLERYLRLMPSRPDAELIVQHEMMSAELYVRLRNADFTFLAPNQGWKGLTEKVRREHEFRRQKAKAEAETRLSGKSLEWSPVLGEQYVQGIKALELHTEISLVSEGIEMAHCVGDGYYTLQCMAGTSAIFRLSHPELGTTATLQMSREDASAPWRIAQLAGPGNARPMRIFWEAAHAIRNLMA